MQNEEKKIPNLQKKSHEILLKLLNNIGIVGAILSGIADLVFVLIFIFGIQIEVKIGSVIMFSVINAVIGVLINILLRYQGQKYAEIENEYLCKLYYNKKVKEEKKHLSLMNYNIINAIKDIIIKGCTSAFCIFGVIYISLEGSKNPIQILITLANLILFACFGLIAMNNSYTRFYNYQIPYMQKVLSEREVLLLNEKNINYEEVK